jgi:hypothetical protein
MDYARENYRDVQLVEIATSHDTFRVFDKPAENRLMITSSLAMAAGAGAVGGLLLNPTAGATPQPVFREAVDKFLASTGRSCVVTESALLIQPQWEFRYTCQDAKVAAR